MGDRTDVGPVLADSIGLHRRGVPVKLARAKLIQLPEPMGDEKATVIATLEAALDWARENGAVQVAVVLDARNVVWSHFSGPRDLYALAGQVQRLQSNVLEAVEPAP
jgi:hypothetical protein